MRLSENGAFRRRFACQTIDVFARILADRRRSLLRANSALLPTSNQLGEFDGPCFLAAKLLEDTSIQKWVAASFPIVVIDEAQDLDQYRLGIVKGLTANCNVVAAADAFQCLNDGNDTTASMGWLETAGETRRLTEPRRTSQRGLLAAAGAVRAAQILTSVLTRSQRTNKPVWYAEGFRLIESYATNAGIVARTIASELQWYRDPGPTAILTPDGRSILIRDALEKVATRIWPYRGGSFGPFPLSWELADTDAAKELLAQITLPATFSLSGLSLILRPIADHAAIANALGRMHRLRSLCGRDEYTSAEVVDLIREAVRNQSRFGFRQQSGTLAMTIQRAKNREFQNVIVLWPHSVTGSPEHLRRLLYNGITRAKGHCSVIVIGQNRLAKPPFAATNA